VYLYKTVCRKPWWPLDTVIRFAPWRLVCQEKSGRNQIGIGLLVTALLFGTLSAGLALLEQIRDGMRCMVSSLPDVPE